MQPNNVKPSGLVGADGRPIGETSEQRIIREFNLATTITNEKFRRIRSPRVAMGLTVPNEKDQVRIRHAVERMPFVIMALREIEEKAKDEVTRGGDRALGVSTGLGEAANILRHALFGQPSSKEGE